MKEILGQSVAYTERFNPGTQLNEVCRLYAQVFAGPPWNEYTQCSGCLEFFGLQTNPGDQCQNCGQNLVLAYPEDKTRDYILEEFSQTDSSFYVAKKNGEILGFSWGYTFQSPARFTQKKYHTWGMQEGVRKLLEDNGIINRFFYYSECGVKEDERGKGISNQLCEALLKDVRSIPLPIILRTNWQSPMMAVAERFGMIQLMGPRVRIDRFNKIIQPTGELMNGYQDSEIAERVLFVLRL